MKKIRHTKIKGTLHNTKGRHKTLESQKEILSFFRPLFIFTHLRKKKTKEKTKVIQ